MIQFQENTETDGRTGGWTISLGHGLFHWAIPATAESSTSTTAVDWYLKVKDIGSNISLIKYYWITARKKSARFIKSVLRYSRI